MWTDPAGHVFVTGEVVTAATMNTYIKDNLVFLGKPPRVRVFDSAGVTLTTATLTVVPMNSERYDTDAMHDNAVNPSRMTIKTAGLYSFGCNIRYAANAVGTRAAMLRLNGTLYVGHLEVLANTFAGASTALSVWNETELWVNDYIEVIGYQASGGNLAISRVDATSPEAWASWRGNLV